MQGEHNDVNVGRDRFDVPGSVESVHNRHGKVQENHIGLEFFNSLDGLPPIFGLSAYLPIGFFLYTEADGAANGLRVIDDKNSRGHYRLELQATASAEIHNTPDTVLDRTQAGSCNMHDGATSPISRSSVEVGMGAVPLKSALKVDIEETRLFGGRR